MFAAMFRAGSSYFCPATTAEGRGTPLGNFTINHYSRIEFSDEAARVTYILDLAEIPTLQQKKHLDTDGDGTLSIRRPLPTWTTSCLPCGRASGWRSATRSCPLRVLDRSAKFVAGQGDYRPCGSKLDSWRISRTTGRNTTPDITPTATTKTGSAGVRSWSGAVPASQSRTPPRPRPTRRTSCVPIRRIHLQPARCPRGKVHARSWQGHRRGPGDRGQRDGQQRRRARTCRLAHLC